VVVIYEYFYPGFKAGGPIQSLTNLVNELGDEYLFKIITTAYDLNEKQAYENIPIDCWSIVNVSGIRPIEVYYSSQRTISLFQTNALLKNIQYDVVFVGGLFTSWSFFPTVLKRIGQLRQAALVISPRGMLQKGALISGALKKKLYLRLTKVLGFYRGVTWHATDDQEEKDIKAFFGRKAIVKVAKNVPKKPISELHKRDKKAGSLRMIYLSLIAEKKNLHLILNALKEIKDEVEFDIYGPIKDIGYWRKCERLMVNQPQRVRYMGLANPKDVQMTLSSYHAFVLPTKGENFGHAIYESLSVGTPALISKFTPWGDLNMQNAGVTLATEGERDLQNAIQRFIDLDQDEFARLSHGAHSVALEYYNKSNFKSAYVNLFEDLNDK